MAQRSSALCAPKQSHRRIYFMIRSRSYLLHILPFVQCITCSSFQAIRRRFFEEVWYWFFYLGGGCALWAWGQGSCVHAYYISACRVMLHLLSHHWPPWYLHAYGECLKFGLRVDSCMHMSIAGYCLGHFIPAVCWFTGFSAAGGEDEVFVNVGPCGRQVDARGRVVRLGTCVLPSRCCESSEKPHERTWDWTASVPNSFLQALGESYPVGFVVARWSAAQLSSAPPQVAMSLCCARPR